MPDMFKQWVTPALSGKPLTVTVPPVAFTVRSPLVIGRFNTTTRQPTIPAAEPTDLIRPTSIAGIVARSEILYLTIGNIIYTGVISAAPETALFHALLGIYSIRNIVNATRSANSTHGGADNTGHGIVRRILNSPGLGRLLGGVTFSASTAIAFARSSVFDTAIFGLSAISNFSAAHVTNRDAGYTVIRSQTRLGALMQIVKERLPAPVITLLVNPGPSALAGIYMIGLKSFPFESVLSSPSLATTFCIVTGITAYSMFTECRKLITGVSKHAESFTTKAGGALCTIFGVLNAVQSNYLLASCLTLWAASSWMIGYAQDKAQRQQEGSRIAA